jgi:nucleoside-diphosphate-sugar epimerase
LLQSDLGVTKQQVGLIGATSLVGRLLSLQLADMNHGVVAYTRKNQAFTPADRVQWRSYDNSPDTYTDHIECWICAAPIWVIPEHFDLLESEGARRVVALSSTSRFGKKNSDDLAERQLAQRLANAEETLQHWAEHRNIQLVILRPTLIYGHGLDKNISEIARFIRRFSFFPLFAEAQGLRQPVHADDIAKACISALLENNVQSGAYNLSGGETLHYREMVTRIFKAMGKQPRLLPIPLWLFALTISVLRLIPRYRHWSSAMAQRMNQDLVFDHSEASEAFGFRPRGFNLTPEDLPK